MNHLTLTDIKLDDEFKALLWLSSLLDNREVLVITLTNSSSNGKLVMSIVKDIMLDKEVRRNECAFIVTPNKHKALVTKSMGRSKTNFFISETNMRIAASQQL